MFKQFILYTACACALMSNSLAERMFHIVNHSKMPLTITYDVIALSHDMQGQEKAVRKSKFELALKAGEARKKRIPSIIVHNDNKYKVNIRSIKANGQTIKGKEIKKVYGKKSAKGFVNNSSLTLDVQGKGFNRMSAKATFDQKKTIK